jgi:glycosyltransferase involved in cell wall biosynthesis
MRPDIDVLVPVRDGGPLLREAVESVLDQDGVDVQVIVVDDGSTDGAPDRLPRDPRVTVIRQPPLGIPQALNVAHRAGQAPLVARQDADDRSLPGRLLLEAAHLEQHPGIGLVATAFEVLVGARVVTTMRPLPGGMLGQNPICAGSTMVRRTVMDRAGVYRDEFRLSCDYDAWLRCAWVGGVSILPTVGYQYRLTASMATISRAADQRRFAQLARESARSRIDGTPDPVDRVEEYLGALPGGPEVERAASAETAMWWAREFAALGARREAWRCARVAARLLPPRRTAALVRAIVRPPEPQATWA